MKLYVTNNPLVNREDSLIFVRGGVSDVFTCARDLVHKGHRLLTHPLSGSVKPGETPYKTLVLTKHAEGLCMDSLRIIEESLLTARKLATAEKKYTEEVLKDFQLIDFALIFGKGGT